MEQLKLVIVGHVDHGKSTLIGRLLYDTNSLPEGKIEEIKKVCLALGKELEFGYVMDNLEEERDQGITIDTTQTFFKSAKRDYVIIDAPGHVEFVKNMITGASQAEAAILIVDADEGVQEQTRRHAYILSMIGLKQVVVVVNKMDLVEYSSERFEKVKKELIEFLEEVDIKPSYIIPISSKKGDNIANKSSNMEWYDGITVLEGLDTFKIRTAAKKFRLAVQDVYKYEKRINVGRVESGTLESGKEIVVLPSGERTSITSIEEFGVDVKRAEAGRATGFVTKDKMFIDRGSIICYPNEEAPVVKEFRAKIFWMSKEPLKQNERIILKCSTQETVCSVSFDRVINSSTLEEVDKDKLENREVANVVIKTENPIIVEDFNEIEELGRFVLERLNTCAGGIVTK